MTDMNSASSTAVEAIVQRQRIDQIVAEFDRRVEVVGRTAAVRELATALEREESGHAASSSSGEQTPETELRNWLWVNHGCSVAVLYGDDGERQCNDTHHGIGFIDFKRDPLAELVTKSMQARAEQSAATVRVLRAAMKQYAWHQDGCTKGIKGKPCTCGFDDALNAIEAQVSSPPATEERS